MKSLSDAIALYMQVTEFAGERQERIGGYDVCPEAAMLPLMTEEEFAELQQSIEEDGLRNAIKLNAQEKVVDGRNRFLACLACDIEPTFEYSEIDDVKEVDIQNFKRRNMEPGRRAIYYLRLHGLPEDSAVLKAADPAPEAAKTEGKSKADRKPGAASTTMVATGPKKTREEAAKEAGVAVRTLQQATNVMKHAEPEIQDAVASGDIPVSAGEAIATLPPEEQREIVNAGSSAEITQAANDKERQIRQEQQWATFDFKKWSKSYANKASKTLAAVPPDQHDRCKSFMAEVHGSTVRLEKETESFLNAESIVPHVEEIISGIPKSERASSELALANRYASVVRAKDSEAAMTAISTILEGLSEPQRKKTEKALREKYAPQVAEKEAATDTKPRKAKVPNVPTKPSAEKASRAS